MRSLGEVAMGLVGEDKGMEGMMDCGPEAKASALAKIDEAMQILEKDGMAYDQAANMLKEHLSVEEQDEPAEEPMGKGAKKLAAIMALKKKASGIDKEEEEDLA